MEIGIRLNLHLFSLFYSERRTSFWKAAQFIVSNRGRKFPTYTEVLQGLCLSSFYEKVGSWGVIQRFSHKPIFSWTASRFAKISRNISVLWTKSWRWSHLALWGKTGRMLRTMVSLLSDLTAGNAKTWTITVGNPIHCVHDLLLVLWLLWEAESLCRPNVSVWRSSEALSQTCLSSLFQERGDQSSELIKRTAGWKITHPWKMGAKSWYGLSLTVPAFPLVCLHSGAALGPLLQR